MVKQDPKIHQKLNQCLQQTEKHKGKLEMVKKECIKSNSVSVFHFSFE